MSTGSETSQTTPQAGIWTRLRRRPDPLTGVALTLPVFVTYHLGVLAVTQTADVDLVSGIMLRLLEHSAASYVIATLAFALGLSALVWVQQKRGASTHVAIGPVLVESLVLSIVLFAALGWATELGAGLSSMAHAGRLNPIDKLVLALGSGFHEELLFRALLVTGGCWAIERLARISKTAALPVAIIVSSLLFALSRHFGSFSHPFVLGAFAYTAVLGLLLCAVYLTRGFAVAVYTHVFYAALIAFAYS